MQFNVFITFSLLFACNVIQGSSQTNSIVSSITTKSAAELQACKKRQLEVLASEPKKTEIGTVFTLFGQFDQVFIYGSHKHKKIELNVFSEKYPDFIDSLRKKF